MKTDIFIKTCAKDLNWLSYCLKSIEKFATGFDKVIIVCDKNDYDITTATIGLSVTNLKCVVKEHTYKIYDHELHNIPFGYQIQKVVKLTWTSFSDADRVLQIDSDCIFTRPCDVSKYWMVDDKIMWIVSQWKYASKAEIDMWERGRLWFTNYQNCEHNLMVLPGFTMDSETTTNFIQYIFDRFRYDINELFTKKSNPHLSVYNTFGLYLWMLEDCTTYNIDALEVYDKKYEFVNCSKIQQPYPLKQYWSWGKLTDEIKDEICQILE